MDWMALIKDVGVPLALVVYFVWQGSRREDRLAKQIEENADAAESRELALTQRIDRLEEYQRTRFESLVAANTAVMGRLERFLEAHTCDPKPGSRFPNA